MNTLVVQVVVQAATHHSSTSKMPIAHLIVIYDGTDSYRINYEIEGPEELTANRPKLVVNGQPVETHWTVDDPEPIRSGNKTLRTEPLYFEPLEGVTELVVTLSWLCEISPVMRVTTAIDPASYAVTTTLGFFSVTVRVRRLELE